ncbi:selenoprotein Pb-like [Dreissena polymorpha]|uniref:selenoprotein Pb-like n=1 Tax=Dreissena polymorpha TaxID=45954 RepID=UPI002264DC37|nr:selenoprotein Pb-like [Dreissena polymorpha]
MSSTARMDGERRGSDGRHARSRDSLGPTAGQLTFVSLASGWVSQLDVYVMLQNIRGQLAQQNITDIRFLVVNAADQHSVDNVGELARRVTFPVYQDTERAQIWRQLGGEKDDLLVYDRCGLLTHHLRLPNSLLNKRHFQNALWETYFDNPCQCDLSSSQILPVAVVTPAPNRRRPNNRGSRNQNHNGQHNHHHHHNHHQHQQGHRNTRMKRDLSRSHDSPNELILIRSRMREILSNRISSCRPDDTLCHIIRSNGLPFRPNHRRFVKKNLNRR